MCHCGTDLGQVVGNDAPSDPSGEAIFAVIECPVETVLAFEHTNTSFDTGMEAAPSSEPGLRFVLRALSRFATWFGQDDTFDSLLLSVGFVLGRIESSVSANLIRRPAELLYMIVNGGLPLGIFGWIAGQDRPASDNAAVGFIQPDLVTKLGLLARLLAANDIRVWLKEADQFLLRWHRLAVEDTTDGLVRGS